MIRERCDSESLALRCIHKSGTPAKKPAKDQKRENYALKQLHIQILRSEYQKGRTMCIWQAARAESARFFNSKQCHQTLQEGTWVDIKGCLV